MTGDEHSMPRLSIRKSLRKMSGKSVEDVVKQGIADGLPLPVVRDVAFGSATNAQESEG